MAHYAKVLDGKVTNVIVAEADFFETFIDTEPGQWIQTSYNTPKPYASWTLNETTCLWDAPIVKPNGDYVWNEELYQSDNTQGWVEVTND
jgi:hypothetical protein